MVLNSHLGTVVVTAVRGGVDRHLKQDTPFRVNLTNMHDTK
eukprot:SAG31_NODE_13484_length_866_cov_0.882660_1_plen_40_part_10